MSLNSDRGMAALGEVNETKRFTYNPTGNTVSNHGASTMTWRACDRKQKFADEQMALAIAAKMYSQPMEAYRCHHCGKWHLARDRASVPPPDVLMADYLDRIEGLLEEIRGLLRPGDRRSRSKTSEVA